MCVWYINSIYVRACTVYHVTLVYQPCTWCISVSFYVSECQCACEHQCAFVHIHKHADARLHNCESDVPDVCWSIIVPLHHIVSVYKILEYQCDCVCLFTCILVHTRMLVHRSAVCRPLHKCPRDAPTTLLTPGTLSSHKLSLDENTN